MGTSEKTFQQVKAILGKLDRSIDSLRAQRTGDAPGRDASAQPAQPSAGFASASPLNQTVGQPAGPSSGTGSPSAMPAASQPTLIGASNAQTSPAFNRPASPFGRATPIRPTGS